MSANLFDAAVLERLEAGIAALPEERRETFRENLLAGEVRFHCWTETEGFVSFVVSDPQGMVAKTEVKAPSPQPPD